MFPQNPCFTECCTRLIGAGVKVPQPSRQHQNGYGEKGVEGNGTSERSLFESPPLSPVQNYNRPLSEFSSSSSLPLPHSHEPKNDKVPTRRKSVQFNLPSSSSCDGYESDDNDSASDSDATIDHDRRVHTKDHRYSNSHSSSHHSGDRGYYTDSNSVSSASSLATSDSTYEHSRRSEHYDPSPEYHKPPIHSQRETDPDSDSTIELPPRFDEHGRLLDRSPPRRPPFLGERYVFMTR